MHAIQPPRPSLRPVGSRPVEPVRRSSRRTRPSLPRHTHRTIAAEVGAKLAVNLVLTIAAGSALVKLLPHNISQEAKLQELRTEVAFVEGRVDHLRGDFNRHFDPQQAQAVMQEQSSRVDPRQRQVVWLNSAPGTTPPTP
jgi:hypothetical protein